MTQQEADALALEWIEAWNAHDLEAILSHYDDNVIYASPLIASINGDPTGAIHGKDAVRAYMARALVAYPELRFTLRSAFAGVNSLVLYYESVRNLLAAEVFTLGSDGRFVTVQCHYRPNEGS